MATMSIIGLYNYNNNLFSELNVPSGVDKDVLIENILMECGNLECFYPNYEFLHFAIKNWSAKELPIWESLKKTFELDYNPIWNVDGTERETIKSTSKGSETTKSTSNAKDTTVNQTAGYNSNEFQNHDKSTNDGSTNGEVNSNDSRNEDVVREKIRGGNIGVTMTQQMLEAELNVRPKLNIYNYIIASFKSRFCLLIY